MPTFHFLIECSHILMRTRTYSLVKKPLNQKPRQPLGLSGFSALGFVFLLRRNPRAFGPINKRGKSFRLCCVLGLRYVDVPTHVFDPQGGILPHLLIHCKLFLSDSFFFLQNFFAAPEITAKRYYPPVFPPLLVAGRNERANRAEGYLAVQTSGVPLPLLILSRLLLSPEISLSSRCRKLRKKWLPHRRISVVQPNRIKHHVENRGCRLIPLPRCSLVLRHVIQCQTGSLKAVP